MKIQRIRFTSAALAMLFLTTAFVCLASVTASAQTLSAGEIIYSRVSTSPNGSCDSAAVWVVGQDGSNDRFITLGLHPRISPDGRKILFKRFDINTLCSPFFNGAPEWWIRDLTTGVETNISQNLSVSFGHYFSPEINRANSQIITDDVNSLCRMNLDGTNRVCVGIPALDPVRGAGHMGVRGSDNLIVVQNNDPNNVPASGLYTMNYNDLSNRQKIPNTVINDHSPAWSNDGQTVAYTKNGNLRGAIYPYFFDNLYTIKPDGSNNTQLTFLTNLPSNEGFSYSLVWTLDNSTILNAARLNGVAGIYKIAADGSGGIVGTIPITAGAAPDWVGGIVPAQPGGGSGSYQLLQSVIAGGGGQSANANYSLTSTIGEAVAGVSSTGGTFNLQSGFWGSGGQTATIVRTLFDYDGDGKADVSVFRPSSGAWYSLNSSTGFYAVSFGQAGDKIVPADFDGDGKTDVGVFRPSIGTWFLLGSTIGFRSVVFGSPGDIPAPADFDGDGKMDVAVFRPSTGTWYIQGSTAGFQAISFGQAGDVPVAADYDGDGRADVAVFRPSTGAWYELQTTGGFYAVSFGLSTDLPVKADYDGDGKTDVAVFRPSNGTWYLLQSTNGFRTLAFGTNGDVPAAADYDGDGRADEAVYRGNNWFIERSTAGFYAVQFGAPGDIPTPSAFVP